jgi:hypothetical protein
MASKILDRFFRAIDYLLSIALYVIFVETEFTYKLALNSANALLHVKGALKISRFAG